MSSVWRLLRRDIPPFPIILAVCALTALVGMNYVVVCRAFPEGGGVYSAAKSQGRLLAVVGALLLVADLTVTAALSGWAALSYLGVPQGWVMIRSRQSLHSARRAC